jgi:prepilin-type N-terminal cleavage/methylation domain-containing protein
MLSKVLGRNRPDSSGFSRGTRGFTVIELLVTMSVIVLIIVAASLSLGVLFKADLKTSSGKVAASVRYIYSLSVLNNQSYRLVIDMENGEYWAEERPREGKACDVFLVEKEGERSVPKAPTRKKKGAKGTQGLEDEQGAGGGQFERLKDNLLKKKKLPGRVKFMGAITTHHSDVQEEGVVEINFFPAGYVEHSFIYVGEEDEIYTIESVPLMGTAEIHRERLQPSSLFATR